MSPIENLSVFAHSIPREERWVFGARYFLQQLAELGGGKGLEEREMGGLMMHLKRGRI